MDRKWKLVELLNWTADYLAQKGFENSRLNAERLLADALNMRRLDLYLNFDRPLSSGELSAFKQRLQRRLRHEPLQYILGVCEFYSLELRVRPGVLIPRPETEILVEQALAWVRRCGMVEDALYIADVGTGSGNLAVAIACNLPAARLTAVDISEAALSVARENAERHGVAGRMTFELRDATQPWPQAYSTLFNLLLCNPPYIRTSEYSDLPTEVRDFEPREALLGGEDGLGFYRGFAQILPQLLADRCLALLEIGVSMAGPLTRLFGRCGYDRIEIVPDLAGRDRALKIFKGDSYERGDLS